MSISIIDRLQKAETWEDFYNYKMSHGNMNEKYAKDLRKYIDNREYLPVVRGILAGESFSFPEKTMVNKSKAGRKRTVYRYGREENYVLKLISHLLHDYDYLFAPNLYSFRRSRTVKTATENILSIRNLDERFVYKLDISDYFNSVNTDILLPDLREVLKDDPQLYIFLEGLLTNPYVVFEGEVLEEKKGIMAGVPVAAFLANLYLRRLDYIFYKRRIPYMRYSDDIIVFAETEADAARFAEEIKGELRAKGLRVNPEKEVLTPPHNKWEFLGFSYCEGVVDISPVSFAKLKGKMHRKTRALNRWAKQKNLSGVCAAKAFVKRFNTKLYDNPVYSELTWSRWFFPIINTSDTLKEIDEYMQECIRFLATDTRTKSRYNFRYEDIKALGYRSLVNEYYKMKREVATSEEK